MIATPNESFSRSEPKSTRSSPTPGRPPPWMSWKSAGKISAASARSSIADWALAAVRLKVCLSRGQAADQHRRAQHQQDVADDRADDRGLHDLLEALEQGEEGDDQLGRVAEGHVQQPADAGPGLAAMASVASPITAAQGITPSAAAAEDEQRGGVRELERDRDRDEDARGSGRAARGGKHYVELAATAGCHRCMAA